MTLMHPFYDVAIFEPNNSYKVLYAYPVSKNSSENFLLLLNYWIKMERDYGELDSKIAIGYWEKSRQRMNHAGLLCEMFCTGLIEANKNTCI